MKIFFSFLQYHFVNRTEIDREKSRQMVSSYTFHRINVIVDRRRVEQNNRKGNSQKSVEFAYVPGGYPLEMCVCEGFSSSICIFLFLYCIDSVLGRMRTCFSSCFDFFLSVRTIRELKIISRKWTWTIVERPLTHNRHFL